MPAGARVCGGVPVRRRVTAGDVAAAATHAQMHPPPADRQAILTPANLLRALHEHLIEMCAYGHRYLL